eukprot:scaffold276046_cov21-Tisochrysis_lutea.AAC.1
MEFVNSIAHIVHTSVAMHGGAANKNIGDAFLLVSRCVQLSKQAMGHMLLDKLAAHKMENV